MSSHKRCVDILFFRTQRLGRRFCSIENIHRFAATKVDEKLPWKFNMEMDTKNISRYLWIQKTALLGIRVTVQRGSKIVDKLFFVLLE